MSDSKFVEEILKDFSEPNESDIKKELEKLSQQKKRTKFLNSILSKYSNTNAIKKIGKSICTEFIKDICSQLILVRGEFKSSLKLYKISIDKSKLEALRDHFIIKNIEIIQVKNGEENNNKQSQRLGFNLSCIYDDNQYYHDFIKGILSILNFLVNPTYKNIIIKILEIFKNP